MGSENSVSCKVVVENKTKYILSEPISSLERGQVSEPASDIYPNKTGEFAAHKVGHTATGSCGTISWLIEGHNRRLVVMWSSPYNHDHYSNHLAVGLTHDGVTTHPPGDDWVNAMYYDKPTVYGLHYQCREFDSYSYPAVIEDDDFKASGSISSDHQSLAKIIFTEKQDGLKEDMEKENKDLLA